ncbi:type I restriction enzyme endonuclease domain-containing protein [Coleofasciculus sp. LEGE 07092]|uniref:type I restriction enzyme endonuclease domain-containing protein n=2 Tax=unclassified Coleofasciculus TaxID=2692782 RepID=UPI001D15DFEA|nr:type I restriction enzyme endonuclease domain-containing protein [Coleofasciculus sp. LEGE 07092]
MMLMQTIARANRVFGEKVNGLIVDYIGVFRDLQKALAIYGSASGGGVEAGDTPVQSKAALVDELRNAIANTQKFCTERGINSIGTLNYVIPDSTELIDLSQIDFDTLQARFNQGYKRTAAETLRGAINDQLTQMVRLNKSRMNYLDKFQQMIDQYNAGCRNVETFFAELVEFAQELQVEDKRAIAENLEEEELAIFDLLTKPDITLTETEKLDLKKVARELLDTLKQEKLVLDWHRRQQSKVAVKVAIEEILDQLPENYSTEVYQRKCEEVYQHVYESYSGVGRSIYNVVA